MLVLRNMFSVPACLGCSSMFRHVLAFQLLTRATNLLSPPPHPLQLRRDLEPCNDLSHQWVLILWRGWRSLVLFLRGGRKIFSMTSAGDSIETEQITFLHYLLTGASWTHRDHLNLAFDMKIILSEKGTKDLMRAIGINQNDSKKLSMDRKGVPKKS